MELRIVTASEAVELLKSGWPTLAVSLVGDDLRFPLESFGPHHAVLRFHDIEEEIPGYAAPTRQQMVEVLKHASGITDVDRLLVHCQCWQESVASDGHWHSYTEWTFANSGFRRGPKGETRTHTQSPNDPLDRRDPAIERRAYLANSSSLRTAGSRSLTSRSRGTKLVRRRRLLGPPPHTSYYSFKCIHVFKRLSLRYKLCQPRLKLHLPIVHELINDRHENQRQSSRRDQATDSVESIPRYLQAKVIDADGNIVARGEAGEMLVRGYSVMRGYWTQPEETAAAIDAAGWMHTGDLAVIEDDGNARIVGRVKGMIIRAGENIYPAEIENFVRAFGHHQRRSVWRTARAPR